MFKMIFSGNIKRIDVKDAGGKAIVEMSMCRKNYCKEGAEQTFTWLNITVWNAPDWICNVPTGTFIAGCGEFTLRSYEAKDGTKKTVADVRCNSFDIQVAKDEHTKQASQPQHHAAPSVPPPADLGDDEPPF